MAGGAGGTEIPYRADIDGLRAIAVLFVIGFHANPKLIPGGFVGVDIFFVISGFLISSLILNKLKDNSFSFLEFYGRRIRRLFPALTVVLFATLILGWFALRPADYLALGQNILGGAGFVANIQTYLDVGYFDAPAATKPLLHLWSLGVEEQFYFVFPAVLLLAWRCRAVAPSFVVLGILSFGLNIALVHRYPSFTFYLPFARFWEFIVGGWLALGTYRGNESTLTLSMPARRDSIAAAGVLMIVAGAIFTSEESFPGWWAVLPVLGSFFLIGAGPHAWVNRKILARPATVYIGLISYPLYLWHWPLLVIGRTIMSDYDNQHARTTTIVAIVLTFVLSWLTYRFVELPIRTRRLRLTTPWLVADCSLGLGVVAVLGLAVALAGGLVSRYPEELRPLMTPLVAFADFPPEDAAKGSTGPWFITYGDSNAFQLLAGLRSLQNERQFRFQMVHWENCSPIVTEKMGDEDTCRRLTTRNAKVFEELKPDIVVIGALWVSYFHRERLRQTIQYFHSIGVRRIVVIGQVPSWPRPLQEMLYRAYKADPLHKIPYRLPSRDMTPSVEVLDDVDRQLSSIASDSGAVFISSRNILCDEESCLARLGEAAVSLVQVDRNHLSAVGSRFLISHIETKLFN